MRHLKEEEEDRADSFPDRADTRVDTRADRAGARAAADGPGRVPGGHVPEIQVNVNPVSRKKV